MPRTHIPSGPNARRGSPAKRRDGGHAAGKRGGRVPRQSRGTDQNRAFAPREPNPAQDAAARRPHPDGPKNEHGAAGFPPAKKSLGQHFLHDARVLRRIVDGLALQQGENVLEIGPGRGALTLPLARAVQFPGRLVAIETDGRLIEPLRELLAPYPQAALHHADARDLDWAALQQTAFGGQPFALCANLPYYITSPLIMAALEGGADVTRQVLLVQREVARRLAAAPGTPEYGLLSLAAQRYATVSVLFDVPPGCFTPPPKVTSAVVCLSRRPDAPTAQASAPFFRVARAAFAMRRKTLANNLSAAFALSRQETAERIAACGLSPDIRAEALPGEAFDALAAVFCGPSADDGS